MNISEEVSFDNTGRIERFPIFKRLFLALVIILVATLAFGIGRLTSSGGRGVVQIEYGPEVSSTQPSMVINPESVVASKNGAKYHYLHCAGSKQIKEENKLAFASAAAAEAAGYTLASNCEPQ